MMSFKQFAGITALSALVLPMVWRDEDIVSSGKKFPDDPEKIGAVQITDKIETSDGRSVKANKARTYGHGYIIGSPISSGFDGPFFKTYELHINQGAFADNPLYIGSSFQLSIDSQNADIYKTFKEVEKQSSHQFVFEYSERHPVNVEIESTHYFLKDVYTVSQFLQKLEVESLPTGIKASEPFVGSSSNNKTKVGRIVDVERFGQLDDFCVVEINMTGLGNSGTGEKLVKLSVRDEDIAAWCEKAMALGKDVEIDVAEDLIEVWMPSTLVINAIKFREEDPKPAAAGAKYEQESFSLSDEQYRELRDRLMNDPVFNARKTK